ncbi:GH3 family domain-containing protein [Kaarinaea lacus]
MSVEQTIRQQVLPWIAYPGVVALAIVIHLWMNRQGFALPVSTYVPVITGALLITALEVLIPYRREWHPSLGEVKQDAMYTVLVQIVLPRLLSFAVALWLLRAFDLRDNAVIDIWVHDWPIALQVVVMIIGAEFLRYWVHRLAHTWSPLWRLHAVHHSPDKLYWLNTGRFHPLEKAIQFLFDSLPFILMGVSAEVLALYFVFYATNGFFQHSNIHLKFGFLNYIISTAELHRWHHARDIKESSNNYGNNVIIWDLVFGSWFLPRDRQVSELGLFNTYYPMRFVEQLKTPFTAAVDKKDIPLLGFSAYLNNVKVQLGIWLAKYGYMKPLVHALDDPMKYQQACLQKIIRENSETDYGKEHHFSTIRYHEDFAKQVPIQDYESLRPYIEKQELEKVPALTAHQPHYYAQTSGTTGQPKFIPVTRDTQAQHQRSLAIFACVQQQVQRHSFSGNLLTIPGPYDEGTLPGGSTVGSVSGLMYREMPDYLQAKYVVPEAVFGLKDHHLKYLLILRLALQHKNLTYMVSANPSTFLKLAEVMKVELVSLADDIEQGTFSQMKDLPGEAQEVIHSYLLKNPARADELRSVAKEQSPLRFADMWPNLRLLVTWTGGSCGIAVSSLRSLLPSDTKILELGYLSSELRATITLADTGNAGVPTLQDNYFEFIETGQYDEGIRETVGLDKLETGKQYYLIVTTPAGLYRYFMNDIVEVTGFKRQTPLLRFVQKGKGVTNITGEKLTEHQLMEAVEKAREQFQLELSFYMALACVEQSHYELYIEPVEEKTATGQAIDLSAFAETVDNILMETNNEYESKRNSGRLGMVKVRLLKPGTREAFKTHYVSKGQRESQFKTVLLQYRSDIDFPFDRYCIETGENQQ